jgi:GrpB-like predicted nucleotidyltransferase (UPF0157 family)
MLRSRAEMPTELMPKHGATPFLNRAVRKLVMAEPVVIVEYDPRWPELFQQLRAPVVVALGDLVVAVEHVGSTAVPGLAAKPIIDMDVVVPSVTDIPESIAGLAALGYAHRGDLGIPGREAFLSPAGKPRHHLYVCAHGSEELRRHRTFRDYLLTHPDDARSYEELKKAAAIRFTNDRAAYNEAKTLFVETILQRASSDGERSNRSER